MLRLFKHFLYKVAPLLNAYLIQKNFYQRSEIFFSTNSNLNSQKVFT